MSSPLKLTAVTLVLALVGCGDDSRETAAKEAIEKGLGQGAKVELDRDSIRIETEDGALRIASGQAAQVPKGFPEDVLVYTPGTVQMAMQSADGYTVSLRTEDTPARIVEAYVAAMGRDGWETQSQLDMGAQKMLVYRKGERMANVAVAAVDKATQVTVTVTMMR